PAGLRDQPAQSEDRRLPFDRPAAFLPADWNVLARPAIAGAQGDAGHYRGRADRLWLGWLLRRARFVGVKAVVAYEPGGPEVLAIAEVDAPVARTGEVLFDVDATVVNLADLLQREGKLSVTPGAL